MINRHISKKCKKKNIYIYIKPFQTHLILSTEMTLTIVHKIKRKPIRISTKLNYVCWSPIKRKHGKTCSNLTGVIFTRSKISGAAVNFPHNY